MQTIKNYINGKLVVSGSGRIMDTYEPATGKIYAKLPVSGSSDIDDAVESANKAFNSWSGLAPDQRSGWLLKIADSIEKKSEILARAESKDTGKPIGVARTLDIPRAVANFRFFATAILHTASQVHHTNNQVLNYTNRHPIGLAACISPWNLPLYLLSWKIAPALAAGNCVIAKPSEITPMTAFMLSEICMEAGLPPGVLNILHGPGDPTGQAIVEHPGIGAVSFTGGTQTGRKITASASPSFKKISLEMGGKNPNIIFEDCDFEQALKTSIKSSFTNQGQICLSGSRILIQEGIYEKFRDALVAEAAELKPADPAEEDTSIGALVSKEHMEKVLGYVGLALEEGGTVLTGGQRVKLDGRCADGYFVQPCIIESLNNQCRTNQEEIFGPVTTLIPFSDEEEAIELANDVEYGLSATIWTRDLSRAHRVANSLKSGVVWVNCWLIRDLRTPFGGMKQSGVGREGGEEVLRFFTEAQNVCVKL